jgi:phospho-N-acetylmuramoyl-pentapeptide-transferase
VALPPNLAIFCALVIGALMGFLWFNVHPAQIFMGDSGRWPGRHARGGGDRSPAAVLLAIIGLVFVA